jgi:hypothetical protein
VRRYVSREAVGPNAGLQRGSHRLAGERADEGMRLRGVPSPEPHTRRPADHRFHQVVGHAAVERGELRIARRPGAPPAAADRRAGGTACADRIAVPCAHIALTCERGRPRIGPDEPRPDFAKPQVRRVVPYCSVLSRMAVKILLMRFGVTPHPGFKSRSLRSDLRFGVCRRFPLVDLVSPHRTRVAVSVAASVLLRFGERPRES